jgi:hypothetical protein
MINSAESDTSPTSGTNQAGTSKHGWCTRPTSQDCNPRSPIPLNGTAVLMSGSAKLAYELVGMTIASGGPNNAAPARARPPPPGCSCASTKPEVGRLQPAVPTPSRHRVQIWLHNTHHLAPLDRRREPSPGCSPEPPAHLTAGLKRMSFRTQGGESVAANEGSRVDEHAGRPR